MSFCSNNIWIQNFNFKEQSSSCVKPQNDNYNVRNFIWEQKYFNIQNKPGIFTNAALIGSNMDIYNNTLPVYDYIAIPDFTNISFFNHTDHYKLNIPNFFNFSQHNFFNLNLNFGFGFNIMPQYDFSINTKNTDNKQVNYSGDTLSDGTAITIKDLDYTIFGNDAKRIKLLRPEMQLKMELLYKYAKNKKWQITLTGGFRTYKDQERLYKKYGSGRAAKPGTSRHEFGCAVDLRINGSGSNNNLKLHELGKYAESIGMRWGGNRFNEAWHFDIDPKTTPKGSRQVALKAGSNNNGNITQLSVTPDADYQKIFNGTYTKDYINTGDIIHFKYDDAKITSGKLKPNATKAFNQMKAELEKYLKEQLGQSYAVSFSSGYRSHAQQEQSLRNQAYNSDANVMKKRFKSVAPKGYSEHHTGYAFDITIGGKSSTDRATSTWYNDKRYKLAYEWLKQNANKYGFEQSFPKNNKQGVIEEPWHWRYVGDSDSQRIFAAARKYQGYIS